MIKELQLCECQTNTPIKVNEKGEAALLGQPLNL